MKLKHILFVLACVSVVHLARGQGQARKYSNEFMRIGVGAAAFGMGNAQTATATDVTAAYWNPAGLSTQQAIAYPEVALMHAAYFANIGTYNYIGLALPVDSSGNRRFGVSLIRLGVDDIPNTLKLIEDDGSINYDAIQSFSSTDFAAILSYAWQPRQVKGLSLGTNVKIIYRGVGRFANAWGFGIDLAARYQANGLQLGLVLADATNTFNAWTFNTETFEDDFINTGNAVPLDTIEITRPSLRLGLAYEFSLAKRLSLTCALDIDAYFDGNRAGALWSQGGVSIDPHAGLEFAYHNSQRRPVAFFRAGFYNLQQLSNREGEQVYGLFPTAGVGLVIKNFQLDYALANIGNLSENLHSHVVSLKFHIQ
ncbi:MAG: hypothetical protein D6730_13335 [Bacteroidetes bacterium]|nr:MAG: hypothetical protein D6730_13335 [Bacteroidota bacterium]